MLTIISRKLMQGILMVVAVSAITFSLLSAAGGDALATLRDNPQVSERTIESLRSHYGLDRPLPIRYLSWLGSAVTGDLGESISYKQPVFGLVWTKFVNTDELGLTSLIIAVAIALGLGLVSARYQSRLLSTFTGALVIVSATIPAILLAVGALFVMANWTGTLTQQPPIFSFQFALSAIALALPSVAITLGQFKGGMDDALSEDFVQLARAKGLDEWSVLLRHVFRAAINPFLTVTGLSLGSLLGGAVIVESVMGWPGMGSLLVAAVRTRDVPLVMGITVFASIAVWFGNTVAELLQAINDPRTTAATLSGETA